MERAAVPSMIREQRLNQWIENYSDSILRTCFLYLSDQNQAEDATQDIMGGAILKRLLLLLTTLIMILSASIVFAEEVPDAETHEWEGEWIQGEVNSEEKAILCAKRVYALQEISLGVEADQLEWDACLGEEGGWYDVTAWDPMEWDPQSPPYEVKQFNIKTNGETGAVKDYWFQELMESGKRIEISKLVLLKEEQFSLAEELMSFIQTVSPTDAQKIARWELSVIADISINGSIHRIACFKFFGEDESYVGDVWTDLDDQHRIVQMELASTSLG